MRLSSVVLYRFRNHEEKRVAFEPKTLVSGSNGSGKTALLEALYLVINAAIPSWRTLKELANQFVGSFFVRATLENEAGLPYEFCISAESGTKTATYSVQGKTLSRTKYLEQLPLRAVLFSPIEMNIMYLGPALRRDFIDETLLLAFPVFARVRREYTSALKNRNALLKKIQDGSAKREDLDFWDPIFAAKAAEYVKTRKQLFDFIEQRKALLGLLLDNKYDLSIEYVSKTGFEQVEEKILSYLKEKRERDLILGHTYIGPHLDDFAIMVRVGDEYVRSEHYLSRGENKSLLFALKLLSVSFMEEAGGKKTILLLDDLLSELDSHRIALALESSSRRPFIVASQEIPAFLSSMQDLSMVDISI